MSAFQDQLNNSLRDLPTIFPQISAFASSIISDIDSQMSINMQKTQKFLTKFEHDINALRNVKRKDSESIYKIKKDIEQRKSRNELINMAYEMQEGLLYQLQQSAKNLQELSKVYKQENSKISWAANETEVKTQKIQNQQRNLFSNCKYQPPLKIDKKTSKITFKLTLENTKQKLTEEQYSLFHEQIYEIFYNSSEDRFITSHKNISSAVLEFNFHKNIRKLYDQIIFSHIDSCISNFQLR